METGQFVWRNGEIVPNAEAKISVINHALHYGSGAFEGVRFYETETGPAIFRLSEHCQRLIESVKAIDMKIPYSAKELEGAVLKTIKKNKLQSGYIRPIAFFGEGKMGLNPEGAKIEVIIACWPWGKYLSNDPISVGICPWRRITPRSFNVQAKICGHYVNSIMANQWAQKNNFQEALMLDEDDNLSEGPGENLFLIKNGELLTPPPDNILLGITRDSVITIAREELGLKTKELTMQQSLLNEADEVFFTGTAAEITLIKNVDNKKIGQGNMPIANQIKDYYQDIVTGKKEKYHSWLSWV